MAKNSQVSADLDECTTFDGITDASEIDWVVLEITYETKHLFGVKWKCDPVPAPLFYKSLNSRKYHKGFEVLLDGMIMPKWKITEAPKEELMRTAADVVARWTDKKLARESKKLERKSKNDLTAEMTDELETDDPSYVESNKEGDNGSEASTELDHQDSAEMKGEDVIMGETGAIDGHKENETLVAVGKKIEQLAQEDRIILEKIGNEHQTPQADLPASISGTAIETAAGDGSNKPTGVEMKSAADGEEMQDKVENAANQTEGTEAQQPALATDEKNRSHLQDGSVVSSTEVVSDGITEGGQIHDLPPNVISMDTSIATSTDGVSKKHDVDIDDADCDTEIPESKRQRLSTTATNMEDPEATAAAGGGSLVEQGVEETTRGEVQVETENVSQVADDDLFSDLLADSRVAEGAAGEEED